MSDAVTRLNAALEGRYRVERELGAGGMAVVYLARDLKHNRDVAIKVLRPELAAIVGAERFLAEIEVTANLQHPHILPLFDSGEADTFLYYVMPNVEGESLADRLERERQLPVEEAVRIAVEVAQALDYAHRHGVVHRDVKPANVLLHDGRVLVADFGIALAVRQAGGDRLTETGLSLGTPHYMSPEQAAADRDVDGRSDIYSLGAMLYEMLAGRPPFPGTSLQAVIAAVLTKSPDPVDEDRESIAPGLAAVVHRALARLPADRFQSASDLVEALKNPDRFAPERGAIGSGASSGRGVLRAERLAWAALTSVLLVAALASWLSRPAAAPSSPPVRFTIAIPDADLALPQASVDAGRVAISPDGSTIYYAAPAREGGPPALFARDLDALEPTPLVTDRSVVNPVVSPDGRYLAFADGLQLVSMDLERGTITPLGSPDEVVGQSRWGDDGRLYASGPGGDLVLVAPQGGAVELILRITREQRDSARNPYSAQPLPGGRGILYSALVSSLGASDLFVYDREREESRLLMNDASSATYLPFGVLVYQTASGRIDGVRFDLETMTVTGEPRPLAEGVLWSSDTPIAYAVSANGVLVYQQRWNDRTEIVWVDGAGRETLVATDLPTAPSDVELSPDGTRLAFQAGIPPVEHIWVLDFGQGTRTRVTSVDAANWRPTWTPEGDLSFVSDRDGIRAIYRRPVDGSTPAREVIRTERLVQQLTWRADGAFLFREGYTDGMTYRDLYYRLPGDTAAHEFLATKDDEYAPVLSPDGRWVAYVSNESGNPAVYLRPFPGPGGRTTVSSGPATEPAWAPDGRTVYYRSQVDSLVAASVDLAGPVPRVTGRANLLYTANYVRDDVDRAYTVHPDGERFVFVRQPPVATLVVVSDWFSEVKRIFGIDDQEGASS